MKKRNVTNKDIMKRLDALENRTMLMSAIFLLYSIGIAIVISYFSTKESIHLILGIVCYAFGGLLTLRHKIRRWFTFRIHYPS